MLAMLYFLNQKIHTGTLHKQWYAGIYPRVLLLYHFDGVILYCRGEVIIAGIIFSIMQ